ncbi:hypothetical protein FGO68_gene11617 [Halteria grandinella]|uniref:Uncharacterized protein n=1 Tax=Halteria grandinella TaxID=5974 RepID=A0A8J8TAK5_HALGN|nr:hypothetical protein FGO68_gene11617 [Halteria grandinella]
MQYVWGLLNDLSFLTTLTLISVQIPAIVQVMQSSMLNFIYLDVLKTDQWLIPWIFRNTEPSQQQQNRRLLDTSNITVYDVQSDEEEDTGLNDYFTNNGYGSTKLIKNLQSAFLFILGIVLVAIFAPIIQLLRKRCGQQKNISLFPDQICGTFIRFYIQQFSPLFLSSVINLYDVILPFINNYS